MNLPELKNPFTDAMIAGYGVSSEEYMKNERRGSREFVMSRTALCDFVRCPSKWIRGARDGETSSTEWGSLIDCLILTPDQFRDQFAVAPAMYSVDAMQCPSCKSVTDSAKCSKCKCDRQKVTVEKEWNANAGYCSNWVIEREKDGQKVIRHKDRENAEAAICRIKENEEIDEFIKCSDAQVLVTANYHDKETGLIIPVKCLLDLVPFKDHVLYGQCLADFKTSVSASPRDWQRHVFEYDYHVQGALHMDLYNAAKPDEDRNHFRHIVQENKPPYEPARKILSDDFLQMGRAFYIDALKKYARCLADNKFPGYDEEEGNDNLNGWQLVQPEAWMITAK